MSSNEFLRFKYFELIAMQRVFREAKFCFSPSDNEISASPVVSDLFDRLMDALIESDVATKGESAREQWDAWLAINENREEWGVALERARNSLEWQSLDESQKLAYAKELLRPFNCGPVQLEQFVRMV